MLKKLVFLSLGFCLSVQAQAFDKNQMVLDKDFWGTWSIYNAKNKCTETYQFKSPKSFEYTSKQKKMSGNFAISRHKTDLNALDILNIRVAKDNKKASCADQTRDYTNQNLSLGLKWVSKTTAQICADVEGKQCSQLYLIKQK